MNAFYEHHQIALPCTMHVSTASAEDLTACGRKWIDHFFTAQERDFLGCEDRFYFKQLEYCDYE